MESPCSHSFLNPLLVFFYIISFLELSFVVAVFIRLHINLFSPLLHLLDFDLKLKPHLPSTLLLFVIFFGISLAIVLSIENVIRSITRSYS